ncbi:transcription factor GTE7-like [Chenopodium quinoa]|uniref:transcription factor GTE7-like n=1 Tax=Chenopodium quinoa TaxID=63459 RepID=UPI000B77EC04|nr:transcription factor GTE7-like [Chenopodium quinoa]
MASTMLVSRNETSNFLSPNHHHQPPRTTTNFMGKIPFLNPNPNPNSNFTPNNNHHNQNHNNHFSRKQLNHQNGDEFLNPPVNDNTASFNHHRKSSNEPSIAPYVSYDITGLSKSEIRSLKNRLMLELDKVRSLSNRIETGDFRNGSNNISNPSKKRPFPAQQAVKEPKRGKQQPQSAYVASSQVMKMCAQVLSKLMKQKAGYIFNEPVDVVGLGLHDYHTIVKRPMDLGTIKKNLGVKGFYRTPDDFAADVRLTFNNALTYNPKGHEVNTLAERFLEKFELYYRPVYHKFQSEKQQFMRQQKVEARPREDAVVVVDEVQGNSWSKNPSPEPPRIESSPAKKPEPRPEPRVVELPPRVEPPPPPPRPEPRAEPPQRVEPPQPRPEPVSAPVNHAPAQEPAHMSLQEVVRAGSTGTGRGSGGKLPKPKAKDPNKREMNMEEKQKLGAGLQSLPEEKMSHVIQIIRKRNGLLTQDGDEIELDIEAVDTETLWELDRFVTNYKKMVSKMRRQALMDMQNNNVGHHHHHNDHEQVGVSERMTETVKRGGGDNGGDEDVDIGGNEDEEMPVQQLEIDKDDGKNRDVGGGGGGGDTSSSSSSSSSGSDSSSSSDSDSGSSSGSDSDVDDAQSRDNESKNIPH